ncbi:MAG: glycosyltransferase [Pseudomonadota bacterium]
MRILLLTFGSRGDVQPYVALGRILQERGHEVTLSTGRGFEAMAEAHGLASAPLSVDVRELIADPVMQEALHSFRGKLRAWRASKQIMRTGLDEMWRIAQDVRPDLIVYHIKATPACDIAEALGAAAMPAFQIPAFVPTGDFASPILPFPKLGRFSNRMSHRALLALMGFATGLPLKRWRRESLGLSGPRTSAPFAGYHPRGRALPRLHGYSRNLVPGTAGWPAREYVTGCWYLDEATGWQAPDALSRFLEAGPSPVYVGFGSMPAKDSAGLTETVCRALALSGQRGLLATGWGGLSKPADSEHIHVLEAAPHDWLLPRCALAVHHGGAGTTHQVLRWGLPSVVCPVAVDQPFWGRRVAAVGAGPPPLPQKDLTAEALARALEAALKMATRAAEIGAAMAEEPGAMGAADLVETLAA